MKTVYLEPKATFKTDLQSDTLFGLICWGIRQVFSEQKLEELLAQFAAGTPPFLLSSAFPFIRGEKGTYIIYLGLFWSLNLQMNPLN